MACRPVRLRVSEQGLTLASFRPLELSWQEIDGALLIADLAASAYKPALKVRGISAGAYRFGFFRLKNGQQARVMAEHNREALLLLSGSGL